MVFYRVKSIIHADYLIDDYVNHFRKFASQGILFTYPFNIHEVWSPRVANWKQEADLFLITI
jgi:5'(3')-deoxyribonucleotidase